MKRSRKVEFSQWVVLLNWFVFASWVTASYFLAFFDKNPNEAVTLAVITGCLGSTTGYFIQNAVKTCSANRNGVNASTGQPFAEEVHKIINDMGGDL